MIRTALVSAALLIPLAVPRVHPEPLPYKRPGLMVYSALVNGVCVTTYHDSRGISRVRVTGQTTANFNLR